MNTYTITIKDKFNEKIYNGQFQAGSWLSAYLEGIDYYTQELDTTIRGIEIIKIELVK